MSPQTATTHGRTQSRMARRVRTASRLSLTVLLHRFTDSSVWFAKRIGVAAGARQWPPKPITEHGQPKPEDDPANFEGG